MNRRGLSFVIYSRIAQSVLDATLERDCNHKALLDAAKATGVEEVLKAARRGWYALAPAWADPAKTSVKFFLNPREQHRFNHGWFTVAELEAWAAGHGPVMKDAVKAR